METNPDKESTQCVLGEMYEMPGQVQAKPSAAEVPRCPTFEVGNIDEQDPTRLKHFMSSLNYFQGLMHMFQRRPHGHHIETFWEDVFMWERADVDPDSRPTLHATGYFRIWLNALDGPSVLPHASPELRGTTSKI